MCDKQGLLSESRVAALLQKVEKIMHLEPNIVSITGPVVVIGDLHGQYYDLRQLMRLTGYDPLATDTPLASLPQNYLFLGDYVDRGAWSCEVFLYVCALKAAYRNQVILIRGNHECATVTSFFGFKEECETKYGVATYHRCLSTFQAIPVACIVATQAHGQLFCCHGGISPNVESLQAIQDLDRFNDPGMNGLFCDLLWSDPMETEERGGALFKPNPSRGCSYRYVFGS